MSSPQTLPASAYRWPDPSSLTKRKWLLGHWLLRGEVTAIVAPGGSGKSTISNAIPLCLASGRALWGEPLHRGRHAAWIYYFQNSSEERERQVAAACAFHDIGPEECGDRRYQDGGSVHILQAWIGLAPLLPRWRACPGCRSTDDQKANTKT